VIVFFLAHEKDADIAKLTFLHDGAPMTDSDHHADCVREISEECKVDVKPLGLLQKKSASFRFAVVGYDFNAAWNDLEKIPV
jgi:hypothetical protein